MDYEDDFYEDCEDMDTWEEQELDEPDEKTDSDKDGDEDISLEDFMFWGGYLGINVDEERIKKLQKYKRVDPLRPQNRDDKFDDF